MTRFAQERTADGTHVLRWYPSGTPKYVSPIYSSVATTSLGQFATSNIPMMLVMIEGDTTSAASIAGNTWDIDFIAHFEIRPESLLSCAIPPTPSVYDPVALAQALNWLSSHSVASVEKGGGRLTLPDGAQVSGDIRDKMNAFDLRTLNMFLPILLAGAGRLNRRPG